MYVLVYNTYVCTCNKLVRSKYEYIRIAEEFRYETRQTNFVRFQKLKINDVGTVRLRVGVRVVQVTYFLIGPRKKHAKGEYTE